MGRLVAGSHNRNEFVVINADETGRVKSAKEVSGQICHICGDEIEIAAEGEPFVACNECAFPVCRSCYEYERRESNQACPQCKTRYKRIKGSPRVEGDEEEDDVDDLENEFYFEIQDYRNPQHFAEAALSASLSARRGLHSSPSEVAMPSELGSSLSPEVPLLTYDQEVGGISANRHALIVLPIMGHGKRVHPIPYPESSMLLQPRPIDPKKDLAVYGYGSVAWKDRIVEWKRKQSNKLEVFKQKGGNGSGNYKEDEPDDPDLPM